MKKTICLLLLLLAGWCAIHAQTYIPIPVGGFNNDIIAESGTDAAAVTSCVLDLSNYVMYSQAFATANTISGGIVNSGTIVKGTRTYQLGDFTTSNALYLSAGGHVRTTNGSGLLSFGTPGMYSRLSLLVFSTEGSSRFGVVLKFTDGTIVSAGSYTVLDWFYGANSVYAGVGRISRDTAGPYHPDGLSSEPRFYPLDIFIDCINQPKYLESVFVNYISGSDTSSRGVVLGISGVPYSPVAVTTNITGEQCGQSNGSIALNATGGTYPLTYSWNTTPVQTATTINNLAGGTYTCTVTDSNHCATSFPIVVPQQSGLALVASSSVTDICKGDSAELFAQPVTGNAGNYTWLPGNLAGQTIKVSPADTTTYTVNAIDEFGCPVTTTIKVLVKPLPVAAFTVTPVTVCVGNEQTVLFTGKAGNTASYDWNNFAGATVKQGVGAGPYTIYFTQAGTYELQLQVTDNGCFSPVAKQAVNVEAPLVAPVVTVIEATPNSLTFGWQPVAGAIGYQLRINGVLIGNVPATVTTYTTTGLLPLQSASIQVIALGTVSCRNSAAAVATGKTLKGDYFIPNSFTPNGDGLNDVFKVYGNVLSDVNMKIFNQWGELLFESKGLSGGWDGKQRGKIQPVGVYTYVIKLTLNDGSSLIKKGFIHLIH